MRDYAAIILFGNTLNNMLDERDKTINNLKETLLNVITAVEKERKLSGNGKQLPVIKEAYNLLKTLK